MAEEVNMKLWNQVCETDPRFTEKVVLGRRKFTTIDAQYQIKNATQLWGPYGFYWGVTNCEYHYVFGAEDGGQPISIALEAVFFYPAIQEQEVTLPDGTIDTVELRTPAQFQVSVDMPWDARGETRKKLLTNLTSKALSKLGFNSDVFEGQFDDDRYIDEMRRKHAQEPDQEGPQTAPKLSPAPDAKGAAKAGPGAAKAQEDPFLAAIRKMEQHFNWDEDTYYKILGGMGFESVTEVTGETDRRRLAAALRREMGIPR